MQTSTRDLSTGARPAAVAGLFYPGEADELKRTVAGFLEGVPPAGPAPKAVIVPHAGYIYSGAIAATGYKRLATDGGRITRVVLLGPAHRVFVRGLAAPGTGGFETPLGTVKVDRAAIADLADLPQVVISDDAHALEHSLEVQLPFLQYIAPQAAIVPFAVGDATPAQVAQVIERLWGGPETRFIISSDLSHYLPYAAAQASDSATARLIERFEGAGLGPMQACGCVPVAAMLTAGKTHGLRIDRLDLRNSGDTAGPRDRVVGYGAWALS